MSDATDGERDGRPGDALRRRVVAQFSGAGERATVWRGFERFLPTGAYLNLGYSPRGWPTLLGDSQARLAGHLAAGLEARVGDPAGAGLLDLGCGRGGPARQFARRGFDVTGVDLVAHNVALARANAAGMGADERPAFLVGDATALPLADGAVEACAALDALVYVPEKRAVFAEVARVLADGGWFAAADLVAREGVEGDPAARDALDAFAGAWDMAPVPPGPAYRDALAEAGLTVAATADVSANSTARFRKWASLFLALVGGPAGGALARLLERWDVDPAVATEQVRAARRALPHLRHVVTYARA